MQWSACVDTSSAGLACISGWRPDLTDKCVRCVKLASAETKLSPYMAGEAQVNRTPEKEHPLDHKDKGQSQKTVVAFKDLALEMEVFRCHSESVLFHSVFLLQPLTSMMEDLLQQPLGHRSTWMNSSCLDSSYLSLWWLCSGSWLRRCMKRQHLKLTQKIWQRHYCTSSQFSSSIILPPYILQSFMSYMTFERVVFSKK